MFALACCLMFVCGAEGTVFRVPQDYSTIQSALDVLNEQDTVLVELGTYAEALTAPPLSFTLLGNVTPDTGNFARPVLDPSSISGSDSLACISLPVGAKLALENFWIRNPALSTGATRAAVVADSGVSISARYCRFDSTHGAIKHAPWDTLTFLYLSLEQCVFTDIFGQGVGSAMIAVQAGWVRATECSFSGRGFFLVTCGDSSRFERCIFRDNAHGHLLVAGGANTQIRDCIFGPYGPWAFVPVVLSPFAGVISGCHFIECHGGRAALEVQTPCNGQIAQLEDNLFLHNDVAMGQGSGGATVACTSAYYYPDLSAVLVSNSFLDYNSYLHSRALSFRSGAEVNFCRFSRLTVSPGFSPRAAVEEHNANVIMRDCLFDSTGVAASGSHLFDARGNWWGDSSGPFHESRNPTGIGDTVLGSVLFDPWYTDTSFLAVRGLHLPLPERFEVSAYPNPFNNTATLHLVPDQARLIDVTLYDVLGRVAREVFKGPIAFERTIPINGDGLASGIYIARVKDVIDRRPLATAKLVLLK